MRVILAVSFAASLGFACPAEAVLKRYAVEWTTIAEFNTGIPSLNKFPAAKGGPPSESQAILDESGNGFPVLRKLAFITDFAGTYDPALPAFGVALLGASLLLAGARLSRNR